MLSTLERRLRIAGIVLLVGLFVELFTLLGKGPISFLFFAGLCATIIAAGILLYLHSLVSREHT
jgi:hypothetical protein